MSYGAAAKMFGVPKPMLYRKCSETVVEMRKPGPAQVLTQDQETALATERILLAKLGLEVVRFRFTDLDSDLRKKMNLNPNPNPSKKTNP